jgi:L-ascorbate metabolism protein UlaG (beta-lactamase superfamily)
MHPFAKLDVPSGSVGIHWFEQNAFAFKDSQGTIALVDPYFPHDRPADRFIRPTPPVVEAELPTDFVLLTHDHGDHTHPGTIARIHAAWPETQYVGPRDAIAKVLGQTAVDADHTTIISAGDTLATGPLTVHAFWSKLTQGDPAVGIPPANAIHLGYVVEIGGRKLYVTGDLINNYADHDELLAPIAALEPDIGFLTTHPTEGEFPFFEGSVRMAVKLGLKVAVPSHYACFSKRTYDPKVWAALFPADGPKPLIIPWNSHVIYP